MPAQADAQLLQGSGGLKVVTIIQTALIGFHALHMPEMICGKPFTLNDLRMRNFARVMFTIYFILSLTVSILNTIAYTKVVQYSNDGIFQEYTEALEGCSKQSFDEALKLIGKVYFPSIDGKTASLIVQWIYFVVLNALNFTYNFILTNDPIVKANYDLELERLEREQEELERVASERKKLEEDAAIYKNNESLAQLMHKINNLNHIQDTGHKKEESSTGFENDLAIFMSQQQPQPQPQDIL